MANCLYLHDSYITKFDFINYAFAKLVVACMSDKVHYLMVWPNTVYYKMMIPYGCVVQNYNNK